MEIKVKFSKIDFITSFEKCEREQSEISFRGLKKHETKTGNPFFVFNFDKKEMTFNEPFYLGFSNSKKSKLQMHELY